MLLTAQTTSWANQPTTGDVVKKSLKYEAPSTSYKQRPCEARPEPVTLSPWHSHETCP